MAVKLGKKYRDQVSGFEGVATSSHEYLQGCRRITLERLAESGDKIVQLTFDEPNLEDLDQTVIGVGFQGTSGGPHDPGSSLDQH